MTGASNDSDSDSSSDSDGFLEETRGKPAARLAGDALPTAYAVRLDRGHFAAVLPITLLNAS